MMAIMLDAHSRQILNEDQAVEMLYADPEMEIANLCLENMFGAKGLIKISVSSRHILLTSFKFKLKY